uniref:Uncharacterized protein n=1 Tax=Chrysotila carterae TaxID=13221 RepID=A0A7S4FC14_CHRCT
MSKVDYDMLARRPIAVASRLSLGLDKSQLDALHSSKTARRSSKLAAAHVRHARTARYGLHGASTMHNASLLGANQMRAFTAVPAFRTLREVQQLSEPLSPPAPLSARSPPVVRERNPMNGQDETTLKRGFRKRVPDVHLQRNPIAWPSEAGARPAAERSERGRSQQVIPKAISTGRLPGPASQPEVEKEASGATCQRAEGSKKEGHRRDIRRSHAHSKLDALEFALFQESEKRSHAERQLQAQQSVQPPWTRTDAERILPRCLTDSVNSQHPSKAANGHVSLSVGWSPGFAQLQPDGTVRRLKKPGCQTGSRTHLTLGSNMYNGLE